MGPLVFRGFAANLSTCYLSSWRERFRNVQRRQAIWVSLENPEPISQLTCVLTFLDKYIKRWLATNGYFHSEVWAATLMWAEDSDNTQINCTLSLSSAQISYHWDLCSATDWLLDNDRTPSCSSSSFTNTIYIKCILNKLLLTTKNHSTNTTISTYMEIQVQFTSVRLVSLLMEQKGTGWSWFMAQSPRSSIPVGKVFSCWLLIEAVPGKALAGDA